MKVVFVRLLCSTFILFMTVVFGVNVSLAGFYVIPFERKSDQYVLVRHEGADRESGDALLAALAKITDASGSNTYLLVIEPGVYDIGSNMMQMKAYVTIQGFGEDLTTITGNKDGVSSGVVKGADHAELRNLTVRNTGGGDYATAIINVGASPKISNVTAEASGGVMYTVGIRNNASSSPEITDVTATAQGEIYNYGVYNVGASPTMTYVTATAQGGNTSIGVHNCDSSSPTMTYVTATADGGDHTNSGIKNFYSSATIENTTATAVGVGDSVNFGVYNSFTSSSPSLTMSHVTAEASGGKSNYGVGNENSSPTISYLSAKASGGYSSNYGFYQTEGIVDLKNSETQGSSAITIISAEVNSIIQRTRFDGTVNIGDEDVDCKCVCVGDTCYIDTCP